MTHQMIFLATLISGVAAHSPVFKHGSVNDPLELGDATKDSWALCTYLQPGEAAYYKFTAGTERTSENDKFWLGMYAPACRHPSDCPELDFDYSVAVLGMPANSTCAPWPEWGETVAAAGGILPSTVPVPAGAPSSLLVLSAPAEPLLRGVYEPYTPTSFAPRGACVSDYPVGEGEFTLIIWSDDSDHNSKRHVCVGLGLAEKSVFSPWSVILSGITSYQMHEWNRWSFFALTWPWFLGALSLLSSLRLAEAGLITIPDDSYSWALIVSALIISSVAVTNILVWLWAIQVSLSSKSWYIALLVRIMLPFYISRLIQLSAYLPPTGTNGAWLILYGIITLVSGSGLLAAPLVVIFVGSAYIYNAAQDTRNENVAVEEKREVVIKLGNGNTGTKSARAVQVQSGGGNHGA